MSAPARHARGYTLIETAAVVSALGLLFSAFGTTFSTTNALGGVGFLPPFLAAWGPNVLFAGTGVYLLLRTST